MHCFHSGIFAPKNEILDRNHDPPFNAWRKEIRVVREIFVMLFSVIQFFNFKTVKYYFQTTYGQMFIKVFYASCF